MYLRTPLQFLLGATSLTAAHPGLQPLRFAEDGTFQVSIFEDLHFGEAEDLEWGPQQDVNTTRVMNAILDGEQQQLVVLNGDLITGENTYRHNSSTYIDQIVAPLVQRGNYWASTYGNHDSDFNLSRHALFAREQHYANSLTANMVHTSDAGVTNYYLPVYSRDRQDRTPKLLIWFFDSRGGNQYQQQVNGTGVPIPNWVNPSVVEWFTSTKQNLSRHYQNASIPSLAFVHIPVSAMLAFQQASAGVSPTQEPGINDDNPLAPQGDAQGQGSVSGTTFTYGGQDVPFMQALLDTPGLMAVFSGHDHGDDWCMHWDSRLPGMNITGNGLDLCFGRHTGYGGYGSWMRGSRQVLVTEETLKQRSVQTWTRLEDGSESGRVVLNGTYGRDEYELVEDKYS
ncbi:hypothetical protein B0A48_14424 [Cryoendolithus antarcticus]|uniref:Calcineurin-like phosphoesterase domain-containing protein n=1 Tax=Cryoendolithus antarcticus TaxID=1507870 RepID=A0A1V8SK98_9PEZI|nr:hypothetical protein B0A48_14424 [Cryoendolithus antarcticus]